MKKLGLIITCVLLLTTAQAQIFKKLGEQVKKKVEKAIDRKVDDEKNKVDNKVDQELDKKADEVVDKVKGVATNKGEKPKNDEQATDKTAIEKKSAIAVNATSIKSSYRTKFDFVPGEKIILWDDFADDAIGDFPERWYTTTSGEVVTVDGKEGKWLKLAPKSNYISKKIEKMPENFTIQFDLLCSTSFPNGYSFYVALADVKNGNSFYRDASSNLGTTKNSVFWMSFQPGSAAYESIKAHGDYEYVSPGQPDAEGEYAIPNFRANNEERLAKIAIWRQKQRIRVYVNENKIIDQNSIFDDNINLNALLFRTPNTSENDIFFISNLRLAVGNPDTKNKLLTSGKLVSSGILFDVNSDVIKAESFGTLKEIASILKQAGNIKFKITGHTDNDGDETANLELSKKRALAVKNALSKDYGVNTSNFETTGKGSTQPLLPNNSAENKANNRRVEFEKIP